MITMFYRASRLYHSAGKHKVSALFFLILCVSLPSFAEGDSIPQQLQAGEVDSWATQTIEDMLGNSWVPGATLAIIQGDQILSLKGFGEANTETGVEIDPAEMLFRIGSVSKTMTALTALKMVGEGKLDLDADINSYLTSVRFVGIDSRPVTLRHLLGHRGGFEGLSIFHMVVSDNASVDMEPDEVQRDLLQVRSTLAPRVYDNLGFGVLGYILQEVEGKPFRDVLASELFTPLNMDNAVVGLPDDRWQDAASCHSPGGGKSAVLCSHGLLRTLVQGAGDISVSAADMANYMRALVTPEAFLSPAIIKQWLSFDDSRVHPRLPGMGLGIAEQDFANRRCVGHGGSIDGFVSMFCIFQKQGIGVFLSVNGNDEVLPSLSLTGMLGQATSAQPVVADGLLAPRKLVEQFFVDFALRFIVMPDEKESWAPPAVTLDPAELAGSYFRPDISHNLWGTLVEPLFAKVVTSSLSGELELGGEGPYVETSPMYYEYRGTETSTAVGQIAFGLENGKLVMADSAYTMRIRQPWYKSSLWTVGPFVFASVSLFLALGYSLFARPAVFRRGLRVAGISFALFVTAFILELEYANLAHQGIVAPVMAMLWRLLFPLSIVGFACWLFCCPVYWRAINNLPSSQRLTRKLWLMLVGLSSVIICWLIFLWQLVLPF